MKLYEIRAVGKDLNLSSCTDVESDSEPEAIIYKLIVERECENRLQDNRTVREEGIDLPVMNDSSNWRYGIVEYTW